jgi:hypothetical protein
VIALDIPQRDRKENRRRMSFQRTLTSLLSLESVFQLATQYAKMLPYSIPPVHNFSATPRMTMQAIPVSAILSQISIILRNSSSHIHINKISVLGHGIKCVLFSAEMKHDDPSNQAHRLRSNHSSLDLSNNKRDSVAHGDHRDL